MLLHRLCKCNKAILCRGQSLRSAYERDMAMVLLDQMFHRHGHAGLIVNPQIADPRANLTCIHKDEWNLAATERLNKIVVHLGGHNSNAVHLALQHAAYTMLHARGVIVRIADQNFLTMLYRNILKGLYQLRKKRIGYIRDN